MKGRLVAFAQLIIFAGLSMHMHPTLGQAPYSPFDDLFIPDAPVSSTLLLEAHALNPVVRRADGEFELGSLVYLTHAEHDRNTTGAKRAKRELELARKRYGESFRLREIDRIELPNAKRIQYFDNVLSEPWKLVFESNGVKDAPLASISAHPPTRRYIQRFVFVPVSATEVITIQQLRHLSDDDPNALFARQWEQFLEVVRVRVAHPDDSLKGRRLGTRRYFTAALELELPLERPDGGGQWVPADFRRRTEVWHTPEGDLTLRLTLQRHRDSDVSRLNRDFRTEARDASRNLVAFLRELGSRQADRTDVTYVEQQFGTRTAYGTRTIRGSLAELNVSLAYKPRRNLHLELEGTREAIEANEEAFYQWLAKFRWIE